MIGQIDPRQVEKFLETPRIASERGMEFGTYVGQERAKTKWAGEGNIILPSGEFVKGEEFRLLPGDEQKLLRKLGVEKFNRFRDENVKLETGEWYPSSNFEALKDFEKGILQTEGVKGFGRFKLTDEYLVMDAVVDGYVTYEEIKQVTGLSEVRIKKAVETLQGRGLLE